MSTLKILIQTKIVSATDFLISTWTFAATKLKYEKTKRWFNLQHWKEWTQKYQERIHQIMVQEINQEPTQGYQHFHKLEKAI